MLDNETAFRIVISARYALEPMQFACRFLRACETCQRQHILLPVKCYGVGQLNFASVVSFASFAFRFQLLAPMNIPEVFADLLLISWV